MDVASVDDRKERARAARRVRARSAMVPSPTNPEEPVADYLLIASRDPFQTNDVPTYYDLARSLKERGNDVTVFLVQNGVLPARPSAASDLLTALADAGVQVLADEFSLRERGISTLASGVTSSPLDVVVDHLEAGTKTLWS